METGIVDRVDRPLEVRKGDILALRCTSGPDLLD
jgi:hypothetical protein